MNDKNLESFPEVFAMCAGPAAVMDAATKAADAAFDKEFMPHACRISNGAACPDNVFFVMSWEKTKPVALKKGIFRVSFNKADYVRGAIFGGGDTWKDALEIAKGQFAFFGQKYLPKPVPNDAVKDDHPA